MHRIAVFFSSRDRRARGLASVAVWRFRRRIPGQRWGWERLTFAALVWVLATVFLGAAIGFHAFILAHSSPDTNPWTAVPILLLSVPLYALAEILLCRWAARTNSGAGNLSPPSRPAA